jgi:hypothetical protein
MTIKEAGSGKEKMEKPNCYECKHRGDLVGSAHSCCNHPANGRINSDPLIRGLAILASVGRVPPINIETGLEIKGNPHGIKHGWFNWPWNFDPLWLEQCNGFERKEVNEDANKKA